MMCGLLHFGKGGCYISQHELGYDEGTNNLKVMWLDTINVLFLAYVTGPAQVR